MPTTMTPMFSVQSVQAYQSRAGRLNEELVKEYVERYREGKKMDPIEVCGTHNMGFFIVDGHHRYEAMKRAGFPPEREIAVNVADARIDQSVVKWLASGANTAHGMRRTNDDKRRAVEMALESHPEQSDRAIADHVGTSHEFVRQLRGKVSTVDTSTKRTGIDGKKYPMLPPPPRPPLPKPPSPPPSQAPTAPPRAVPVPPPTAPTPEPPRAPAAPQAAEKPSSPTAGPGEKRSKHADELNRPIPEDLYEHWIRRGDLMSHLAKLREIQRALVAGRRDRDPLYAQVTQETIAYSTNVINAIEDSTPYAVCPWCGGMNPGCKMCGNRGGFVSKFQIERFAKPDPEIWKRVAPVAVESEQNE